MIIGSYIKNIIQKALKEDIGSGDITTNTILRKARKGKFVILAREKSVISGLGIAEAVFEAIDAEVRFKPLVNDGMNVAGDKAIAYVEGRCLPVLAAERTALNFLCWLSGISTLTGRFVRAVDGTRAQIMDTRKTLPVFRSLQKYAVRMGGGVNHRMGLYDQILIKDNHIALIMTKPTNIKNKKDALKSMLEAAKKKAGKGKKIEIEVNNLAMLRIVLEYNPDIIMLDNMSIGNMAQAVKIRDAYRIRAGGLGFKALLEASGRVNIDNVRNIAATGVDRISIGALTHSAPSIDISLEVR
jgi:nicotinate-nucleotide pyrophosphorylase (carboxylating)